MSTSVVGCPDLVILSGANLSNILWSNRVYDDALTLELFSPAGLDAHSFNIEVSDDPAATSASAWYTYQENDPPTDQVAPAASKSRTYYGLTGKPAIRIHDVSGNVAADRTFKLKKVSRP